MSQRTLSSRLERSQAYVSLMERGKVPGLSVADADAICEALGATLVLGVEAPVLLAGSRQRDAAHARCVSYVARRLTALGWIIRREVQIGSQLRPGWIDIVAFDPMSRTLLIIEVKTELVDLGGLERQLGWYERAASDVSRGLGWPPQQVAGVALLLMTAANDERIRDNAGGIRQVFPLRSRDMMRVVNHGHVSGRGWYLAMIDPRSRVRDWCRPTLLDGRRSPAPYRHIADFLRPRR